MIVAMPAGHQRHAEIPSDDRMDGDHHHHDQRRDDTDGGIEHLPFLLRALPSEAEHRIQPPTPAADPVARQREIRNERQVEIDSAGGRIGKHGDRIPHERRPEVRPDLPLIRIGNQVIPSPARAPSDRRRTGWRSTTEMMVINSAILVTGRRHCALVKPQHARDERAGMADADPVDERRDVGAPKDRRMQIRLSDAGFDLVDPGAGAAPPRWPPAATTSRQ